MFSGDLFQLGNHEYVRVEVLYEKWMGVCLVKEALDSMLRIGNIQNRVPWLKFVAIASGHLCNVSSFHVGYITQINILDVCWIKEVYCILSIWQKDKCVLIFD